MENYFSWYTIQSYDNTKYEWHLTALVKSQYKSDATIEFKFDMPSLVCKYQDEEIWAADNPTWILNTLLPHLRTKKDCLSCQLNDEEFDNLGLEKGEIEVIIEMIEQGIRIDLLKDE